MLRHLARKRAVATALMIVLAFGFAEPSLAYPYYPTFNLSADVARATVTSIKDFACKDRPAPYCLSDYTLQILQHADNDVQVLFSANEGPRTVLATVPTWGRPSVQVDGQWQVDTPPIAIPGIVAGELAAAWDKAQRDESPVLNTLQKVEIFVLPGGAIVAFIPPPKNDGKICIAGNCDGRWSYRVKLNDGEVTIQ